MPNKSKIKYQERLDSLIAGIQSVALSPGGELPETRRELESLRARLLQLEVELSEIKISPPEATPLHSNGERAAAPILYEKVRLGFAFTDEKIQTMQEFGAGSNNADHAISLPLSASGQTIGELKIEAPADRALTPEEIKLANSVADQASLQIQSLQLLAETERARADAEVATRSFIHQGWDNYLDAIHHDERIGYSYDQSAVMPFSEKMKNDAGESGLQRTVNVMEEPVGTLFLKPDPSHPFSESDIALINAVTTQIGQQVENIRLLADAARARADAEEATRRLTRQNWDSFTERDDEAVLGFTYDSNTVSPLGTEPLPTTDSFEQALIVQGETIGQLTVMGMQNISNEAKSLAASIAAQASIHLETLRLNEELQKRARELEELDRLKSAFLANMSHELRTPLNSILGFADVMLEELDGPLTENMNNDLGLIQKNGQHLLHLINDVLDMAKIESGKMNLNIEKFNLQEIIEEVTSITSPLASEKNLALFIEPDSDHEVEINADKIRLRQVMINLINNSIKFTDKGKIAIRVVREESNVLISVSDSGLGIPSELLEAVFLEFTQVDTTTTRKAGGTGLGLPISRRLIEMHSGRLWAESSGIDGEGSTFYVHLPIEANINETPSLRAK